MGGLVAEASSSVGKAEVRCCRRDCGGDIVVVVEFNPKSEVGMRVKEGADMMAVDTLFGKLSGKL